MASNSEKKPNIDTADNSSTAKSTAKETKEQKALKEKALKQAKEKAAKEKALKEKAEKQAKEKAEKQAKEKAKREKAEKQAKEKAEKEAKEKAKKDAKGKDAPKKKGGLKYLTGLLFARMAIGGAKELQSNAEEVNKLNVFPVPDGDTGDNMSLTIESGIAAIENNDTDNLAEVMDALSQGMLLGARGNSGVILSQFFAGIAKGFEDCQKADPATLGKALELGVKQAYATVMTPTEGTILTVAREAVEYAVARITPESNIKTFFNDLVGEMHESLERTPELLPALKEAGVVDSGGAGLFYIMDGFNRVLNGKKMPKSDTHADPKKIPTANISAFGPDSVMTYGYCTEFLLRLQNSKCNVDSFDTEELKAFLAGVGDSIVVFKNDSIVKVHVHTFTPEKVIAHCRGFGEFLTFKMENMSVQHTDAEEKAAEAAPEKEPAVKLEPTKDYGVVAVSNGRGIEELLRDLGADQIIAGGQTHNPSTNEFLEAFAKIPARNIFVFPNNGNILMAAEQAAEIYKDAKIFVIPTKSIGTGYVALSSLDYENPDPEQIAEAMNAAIARVSCGLISPSIRDADMNGLHINNGDTIGIVGKEIVVADANRAEAAKKLADILLSDSGKFMITVFCGKDSSEEECFEIEGYVKSKYPDDEVYFLDGGQDIYPYIFVAE